MNLYEYHWIPLNLYKYHWIPLNLYEYQWISTNTIEYHWIPTNTIEYHWISTNTIEYNPKQSSSLLIQGLSHGATSILDGVFSTIIIKENDLHKITAQIVAFYKADRDNSEQSPSGTGLSKKGHLDFWDVARDVWNYWELTSCPRCLIWCSRCLRSVRDEGVVWGGWRSIQNGSHLQV